MHAAFDCTTMLTMVAVLAAAEEAANNTRDAIKVSRRANQWIRWIR
jgi:hypothetical protein